MLAETPSNQIYLLPVRLSDANPVEVQLQDLHWLDLFPDRDASMIKLLEAIAKIPRLSATSSSTEEDAASEENVARFASMIDIFRIVLERIPPSTPESGAANAFYLRVRTTEEGVELPDSLLQKYPKEITFVLEHQYRDLTCGDNSFSVSLSFSGEETRITIPYDSIIELIEPTAHIRIA